MINIVHNISHPLLTIVSEEQFMTVKNPASLIADPAGDRNFILITPCSGKEPDGWIWGDYVSYKNPGWVHYNGINNQQLIYNLNFLLGHHGQNGTYNVHVFYISPQRYEFDFIQNDRLSFIQLNEFYGIYQNVYDSEPVQQTHCNKIKYHFYNPNKRADFFRQRWLYEMLEDNQMRDCCDFSYLCYSNSSDQFDPALFKKNHDSARIDNPDDFIHYVPWTSRTESLPVKSQPTEQWLWTAPTASIDQSLCYIVNETFYNTDYDCVFTEKVFKPIYYGMPFMVFGSVGVLQRLRELGFKTFDGLFDETYDLEQNNELRFKMIVAECKKLCQLPLSEFMEKTDQYRNIVLHNQNNLRNLKHRLENRVNQIDRYIMDSILQDRLPGFI